MDSNSGKILSVNIGKETGTKKYPVNKSLVIENSGMADDAHARSEIRQVSLLAQESIEKIKAKGLDVTYGDFAENLTTEGINLLSLSVGSKIRLGKDVLLEITQIGKVCHNRCRIFYAVGDCVMPKEGIFAKVLAGGEVRVSDGIEIVC